MTQPYVICPEKITSPHASQTYSWMPDNAPCGCKCPVMVLGEVMRFHCPRGHYFIATPKDVKEAP